MITFAGPRGMSIRFATPAPVVMRFASSPVGGTGAAAALPTAAQLLGILDARWNGDKWREGFDFIARPAFFGWSADRVIGSGDFAGAETANDGQFTVPAGGPGYWWFAVRVQDGHPDGFAVGEAGADQLNTTFEELSVLTRLGVDYHIAVSYHELPDSLAGRDVYLVWAP